MLRCRSHEVPLRSDWDAVREPLMQAACRAKFTQHARLRRELLASGDRLLVHLSNSDRFWGGTEDGRGENRLGHILMRLRSEFRKEQSAAAAAAT